MKNTIIFDLGMVLVKFGWRDLLKDLGYSDAKVKVIGRGVFENNLWVEFDWGMMEDEDIFMRMKRESPHLVEDIDRIRANFKRICRPFDYSKELVKTLHDRGYKVYILSNYGKTLFTSNNETMEFLQYIDGGVVSSFVKQLKPHADIYKTLMDQYEINPEDAVFFDDREENCEAARKLGIDAVEVKGLESILEGLDQYFSEDLRELCSEYQDNRIEN